MSNVLKIVKKEKDGKTFHNIMLFGVAIRCVNKDEYSKLYYQVKGYLNNGNREDQ